MTLFNGNLGGDQGEQLAQTALGTEIEISQASLADSWKRSSSFGLDPNGKPVDAVISETELYQSNQKIFGLNRLRDGNQSHASQTYSRIE